MAINLTNIAHMIVGRHADFSAWTDTDGIRATQLAVLRSLLHKARATRYVSPRLAAVDIHAADLYERFAEVFPFVHYDDIEPYVMAMVRGEKDVLWPGRVTRFAQSSGTTAGKSKFIPITPRGLVHNHYAGATAAVAHYLNLYPDSRMFAGKGFILGGSFATELTGLPRGVKVGDLSAHLIDNVNPMVNLFRVPRKKVALMADWSEKLPALIDASINQDITNISGVPSWFLTVLRGVIEKAGATTIHDVWPNLEVFIHGGIAFGPYREQYRAITDPSRMRYHETYNASEGFFATQSAIGDPAMLLLLDCDVFYEFHDTAADVFLPPWAVEAGKTYELVITSSNGLWRYAMGDTVTVRSLNPLKITIAGRTKSFINAFGEEVIVDNADKALAAACRATGATADNYTVAPRYTAGERRGCHQWFIEFSEAPADIDAFAATLDSALQGENSDYQAKRSGNIFLDPPEIIPVPAGTFDRYLAATGKLGGQRKVPRLSNDRHIADAIMPLIAK